MLLVAQLWFRIPFAGLVPDALCGACAVPAGGRGHRPVRLVGRRDHAAGHALLLRHHHALRAAVGPDDADQQHAVVSAILHHDQSFALCDRHRAPGVSGGRGLERADARPVAAGGSSPRSRWPPPPGCSSTGYSKEIMANSNSMAMARAVALAFLGCTLAGCVVGPNFVKPKPSVPPQWSPTAVANGTEGAARVTSERAQTVAWWSSFNDATLTSLVQQSAAAESRHQAGGAAHRGGAGANRRRGGRPLARRFGQRFVGASAAQHQYAERRHFRPEFPRTCRRRWSIPTTSISSASAPPGRSIFLAPSDARSRPPTPRWRRRSRARTRRCSRW